MRIQKSKIVATIKSTFKAHGIELNETHLALLKKFEKLEKHYSNMEREAAKYNRYREADDLSMRVTCYEDFIAAFFQDIFDAHKQGSRRVGGFGRGA